MSDYSWRVTSVFDPDGTGHDFAYTVGLHDLGQPELFMWARPSEGGDAAADWILSPNDRCWQLNELAEKLLAAELKAGDTIAVSFDAGLTRAVLHLSEPVAGHGGGLDAFGTNPEAQVIEVRWELHRPPIGGRRRLGADELLAARARLVRLGGGDGPGRPESWDPDAQYGPYTPTIEALRSVVLEMRESLVAWCGDVADVEDVLFRDFATLRTAARMVGLEPVVDALTEVAHHDAWVVSARIDEDNQAFKDFLTRQLGHALTGAYCVEATRQALDGLDIRAGRLLWALLDLADDQARRLIETAVAATPSLAAVVANPPVAELASIAANLDLQARSDLTALWARSALQGCGTAMWLIEELELEGAPDEVDAASLAIATACYVAVLPHIPDDIAPLANDIATRVIGLTTANN